MKAIEVLRLNNAYGLSYFHFKLCTNLEYDQSKRDSYKRLLLFVDIGLFRGGVILLSG